MADVLPSPICRILYPAVFEMTEYQGKKFYGIQMLFDKQYLKDNPEEMKLWKALRKAVQEVSEAAYGKSPEECKGGSPFDKTPTDLEKYPFYKGCIALNARNYQFPAQVCHQRGMRPILDASEIYGGVYARVGIQPYAAKRPNEVVALSFQNIMKIKDGPPLGGGGRSNASVFGAFAKDDDFDANDTSFMDDDDLDDM